MKFFYKGKDGGPDSNVTGYWLVEIKGLFSIALLKFDHGSRQAYHSHAFNCISWVLSGLLREQHRDGRTQYHYADGIPIVTKKETFHRVFSIDTTWVFTVRGPWDKQWNEYDVGTNELSTLEDGRVVVKKERASP